MANLLEHVLIIDRGRIIVDDDAEKIRGAAVNVAGPGARVEAFAAGRRVLHREGIGALVSLTIEGALSAAERREAQELGLELSPVSLQQYVIRKTLDAGSPLQGAAGGAAPVQHSGAPALTGATR